MAGALDRLEQATKRAQVETAEVVDDPQVPAARGGFVRTADVRCTVDLGPAQDHALKSWLEEIRWTRGGDRKNCSKQAAFVALVNELAADEGLRRRIAERLVPTKGKR